jgi:hypothetical protein
MTQNPITCSSLHLPSSFDLALKCINLGLCASSDSKTAGTWGGSECHQIRTLCGLDELRNLCPLFGRNIEVISLHFATSSRHHQGGNRSAWFGAHTQAVSGLTDQVRQAQKLTPDHFVNDNATTATLITRRTNSNDSARENLDATGEQLVGWLRRLEW